MKNLILRYYRPAENTDEGWEKYSLPVGNGYAGASVFGGTDTERLQFTTNVFANTYGNGGVSNFAELYIDFFHKNVSGYERGLDLRTGVVFSSYEADGAKIERKAFFSYPDKVFAYRIFSQKQKTNVVIRLEIPYLYSRPVEEGGRTGEVTTQGDCLVMRGELPSRNLIFEGRVSVKTDGQVCVYDKKILINAASDIVVFFTSGTSYKLCSEVFLEGNHKASGIDPHDEIFAVSKNALSRGWDELLNRHLLDYGELMGRVELDLGGVEDSRSTEELLNAYQKGEEIPYLEELYYMYGRHLLVSSSRNGTPPASLQGVWSVHDKSPWGSGFWHNINVQMNYWSAFSGNLAETFSAYAQFHAAYRKQAEIYAKKWIKETNPENFREGEDCGWILGTSAFCYEIEGRAQHSGPGTGALTAKMFWDYYDFTRDDNILKEITYPAVHGMAKFLTKCVRDYDGRWLCSFSASPEQILSGEWVKEHKIQQYYHTVGCAFDQQMIYENACDDIKCCEILGVSDETVEKEKEQLSGYKPVQIGYSGQIKEYDEEHFYGEIGEASHRHISQLVALMPGTQIGSNTPAWSDSARRTLELRGDDSTGWALAHRLCAWARTGDGNHAYLLLKNLLTKRTNPNLWDEHPPFQIDGNFGATAGMTEMLLQSHEGYISLLPAIPEHWKNIVFKGLKARGNFTVSCEYRNGKLEQCEIESAVGGKVFIRCAKNEGIEVKEKAGCKKTETVKEGEILRFETEKGKTYVLSGFIKREWEPQTEFTALRWTKDGVFLAWRDCGSKYAVYRAVENDKDYTLIGRTEETTFSDREYNEEKRARLTYKIVAFFSKEPTGSQNGCVGFLHPASWLETERYRFRFRQNNLNSETAKR